jgi:hypothetical protein
LENGALALQRQAISASHALVGARAVLEFPVPVPPLVPVLVPPLVPVLVHPKPADH